MKRKLSLSILTLIFSTVINAQTTEDAAKIVKEYDLNKIKSKEVEAKKKQEDRKKRAEQVAKNKGWSLTKIRKDGGYEELMGLTPDGFPLYFSTNNVDAAKSTRANYLNTGGGLGLTLDGQGMIPREWDGGTVRRTHSGFGGRITTVDDPSGTTYASHATHVAGTIISLPWNTTATTLATKGMASQATLRSFEWTNDESEALAEAQLGMLLSNHSYGVPVTNTTTGTTLPAWYIGAYVDDSQAWDEITYLSPYYLPVFSAGNDGTNNNNASPIATGYDKLVGNKVAKNVLTIANANDAIINADGTLNSVTISSSSSQGPADDRRIKPDIAGNGASLLSTNSTTNTSTTTMSGTSMAAPNVTGTLTLLQQHYKNIHGHFMKASMLKGLACHTADDAGVAGPDAKFGWGLLNAKKAAETITGDGLSSWISEVTLNQGETFTMTVKAVGGATPLIGSATWTDVPGTPNDGTHGDNYNVPALVNDLDIRITRAATTFYPWRLDSNPANLATRTADNNVDNVEVIKVDAPVASGDYVITITHKGTLVGGSQKFALVITGITSTFTIESSSDDLTVCNTQNAAYTFNYKQSGGGTTNFTATGLPSGATATFSPTSLSANGTVTMTVSNLNAVPYGVYNVGIIGNNGTETETRNKSLKVFSNTVASTVQNSPVDNSTAQPTTLNLKWNKDSNIENYNLQISTSNTFATTVVNANTTEGEYMATGLAEETQYYWRVIPSNRCATGSKNGNETTAVTRTFTTGKYTCGSNNYSATDFTNAHIGDTVDSYASVPVVVADDIKIGDLNVVLDITHTWIGDMIITLTGPAAIGSPEIILLNQPCAGSNATYPNIQATLDDSGVVHGCSATAPVVSGTIKPYESLINLNGLSAQGTWTLNIHDVGPGDAGDVNVFALNFCKVEQAILSTSDNAFNKMTIYPNPTKGILNINLNTLLEGETVYTIYDIQGRKIMNKSSNNVSETLNIENFTTGVYMLSIENGKNRTTKKIVLDK
ncbi:MAG: S8 family serine peptidase [Bacteroidota bacterium]